MTKDVSGSGEDVAGTTTEGPYGRFSAMSGFQVVPEPTAILLLPGAMAAVAGSCWWTG